MKRTNCDRRDFLRTSVTGLVSASALSSLASPEAEASGQLTAAFSGVDHAAAVNRRRRVIVNYDTSFGAPEILKVIAGKDMDAIVRFYFSMIDEPGVKIDSVWWCWLDGNYANYPSKILPVWQQPGLQQWWAAGLDPVKIFVDESHKRGVEAFFSYRLNGSDMASVTPLSKPLLKRAHPDWLIHTWNSTPETAYWNFAIKEVRAYKLAILREVAENYNYDGIEIDFARVPVCLPPGHQWEQRVHLTEFMRSIREMTLKVEKERGRSFLLAARVPERLEGCHFDGLDVETWAREGLVDLFVLGNRSYEVDIPTFRRITKGKNIKLYPCLDDHHATDGYEHPQVEVFRGVFANWWAQGADGIQTFNFTTWTPKHADAIGWTSFDPNLVGGSVTHTRPVWELHRQVYGEMYDPAILRHKDKTFVVQRRGGGHGASVVPDPADWRTPRWMYFITNMLAQLPATLANDGKADTLLFIDIADDVAADAGRVRDLRIRMLLSDPTAKALSASQRLKEVIMASHDRPNRTRLNIPPAKGIEKQIELRLNNILLGPVTVEDGWVVFPAKVNQLAMGSNLVGVRINERSLAANESVTIEMLEVQVRYK